MLEADYTINQIAEKFGVTYKTVHRMIEQGELEAYRVGLGKQRRAIRITAQSVSTYIQRHKIVSVEEETEEDTGEKVA